MESQLDIRHRFNRPRGGLVQSRLRRWFNRGGAAGLIAPGGAGSIRRRRGYGGQVAAERTLPLSLRCDTFLQTHAAVRSAVHVYVREADVTAA